MTIQSLFDIISDSGRRTRTQYHLTLGAMIDGLEAMPASAIVTFSGGGSPCNPSSYRGYYEDLAFNIQSEPITVSELLSEAKSALGETFVGYKGGNFVMERDTPLWASPYGSSSGIAITGMRLDDGRVILEIRVVKGW